jgi:type IV pilus assembly protein PilM
MFSLRRSQSEFLGIDISASSVKVVELAQSGSKMELKGYSIVALPPTGVASAKESQIQVVGTAIKKAVKQIGTRCTLASTAVPGSAVIVKTVNFPAGLREDEIEAQIELEAEEYIPYPLEDVSLDFYVLGPAENMPGLIDVQVVASRKELVEDRAAALEWAGLKAEVVDVDSFAMERASHRMIANSDGWDVGEVYALIDSGASATSIIVVQDRKVIFTREHNFGGRQLSDEIQRRYGLSFEGAERAKKNGGLPLDHEAEIFEPFIAALGQQIDRSLHFFQSSQPQVEVKRIFLAGGCAALAGVQQHLDSSKDVSMSVVDPFAGMSPSTRATRANLGRDAPSLLVATGLALQSFD